MIETSSVDSIAEENRLWNVGKTWLDAQRHILKNGRVVDGELIETLNYSFEVKAEKSNDPILEKWAKSDHISEMRKVFHTSLPNKFGHSYRKKMMGPTPGDPVESVSNALLENPFTKRAVITLTGSSKGDVPCLNVIQFLIRGKALYVNYFARGQDVYNKFYADAICVMDIAEQVHDKVNVDEIYVSGTIGSAHIYMEDITHAQFLIDKANQSNRRKNLR